MMGFGVPILGMRGNIRVRPACFLGNGQDTIELPDLYVCLRLAPGWPLQLGFKALDVGFCLFSLLDKNLLLDLCWTCALLFRLGNLRFVRGLFQFLEKLLDRKSVV